MIEIVDLTPLFFRVDTVPAEFDDQNAVAMVGESNFFYQVVLDLQNSLLHMNRRSRNIAIRDIATSWDISISSLRQILNRTNTDY